MLTCKLYSVSIGYSSYRVISAVLRDSCLLVIVIHCVLSMINKRRLLAICRPSDRTVASGVVGVVVVVVVIVVVGVCNRSQMRTSKCTYLIFGVSMNLARNAQRHF